MTPEQVRVAAMFRDYLLSPQEQRALLTWGLRPLVQPSILSPACDAAYGAIAASHPVSLRGQDS